MAWEKFLTYDHNACSNNKDDAVSMYIVRSTILFGYETLMRSLNGNPQLALQAQGMSSAQIRDGDGYLSHESVCQLLESSAEVTNEAAFGFKSKIPQ
jgi:hypothetical protein